MIQKIMSKLFPYNEPSVTGTLLAIRGSVTYRKTSWLRLCKMRFKGG